MGLRGEEKDWESAYAAAMRRDDESSYSQVKKALQRNGYSDLYEVFAEISQVKMERDAAAHDIEFLLNTGTEPEEFCTLCANNDKDQCDQCAPKWRGLCPENEKGNN